MEYTVTSPDKPVCGKRDGDLITSQDIINAGGNEKQLLRLSRIQEVIKSVKKSPAVKEAPVTQQEEVPVFNLDNEQGDKSWQE